MFYMDIDRDLAVAQIQKAGLSTMFEWLGRSFKLVDNETAKQVSTRVAFFRHPIERIPSCYSFLYWHKEYYQPHVCGAPTDSWENFVDYILVHEDGHWMPQVKHVGDTPTIYHRFENLADHFEKYRPGILPHKNISTRLPTNDYRADELIEMCADDLRIWESST